MNTTAMQPRISAILNKELCKRLLVRYFTQKGFGENFNKKIYPPMLQDMVKMIPELAGKVEIEPYIEDIDPNTGIHTLGWNLFVLGSRRMYIGESNHMTFAEVRSAIGGPLEASSGTRYATPKRVVKFITSVLGNSTHGNLTRTGRNMRTPLALGTGEHSGYFKTMNRPVF